MNLYTYQVLYGNGDVGTITLEARTREEAYLFLLDMCPSFVKVTLIEREAV